MNKKKSLQIEKIIELRNNFKPKMSQKAFADFLNVSYYTIKNIETGSQKTIPPDVAFALSQKYPDYPIAYWLGVEIPDNKDKLKLVNELLHFEFLSLDDLSVFELRRLRQDHKINLNWLLDDNNNNDKDMFIDTRTDEEILEQEGLGTLYATKEELEELKAEMRAFKNK